MASSNALNELSTQKSFSIVQTENLNQQPMPEKGEEFIIQDEDPINDTIEIVIEKSNIDRLNFDEQDVEQKLTLDECILIKLNELCEQED